MTAIVGVINSQGIAIAADSASTVTGEKTKKVYNKANKLFTLSKYHPVGIAIFNSANFMSIPLETLIKMYRGKLKEKSYDTLTEYKDDFLKFLKDSLQHVNPVMKSQYFYGLCSGNYNQLHQRIVAKINSQQVAIKELGDEEGDVPGFINQIAAKEISDYFDLMDTFPKSSTIKVELAEFESIYKDELDSIVAHVETEVKKSYNITFDESSKKLIIKTMLLICNLGNIFERGSGLVFFGFGDNEVYPSSQVITLGTAVADNLRYKEQEMITISPGIMNSNILPYVQGDVTYSVLTGIDPAYEKEINKSIETAFETVASQIENKLNATENKEEFKKLMKQVPSELITQLENWKQTTITAPLLDVLIHMGKEDMAELAESLVNITSLKRRFTATDSGDESVGGPVDVAVVTKGDGFIWMKRKHYFDTEINRGFVDKYFRQ